MQSVEKKRSDAGKEALVMSPKKKSTVNRTVEVVLLFRVAKTVVDFFVERAYYMYHRTGITERGSNHED